MTQISMAKQEYPNTKLAGPLLTGLLFFVLLFVIGGGWMVLARLQSAVIASGFVGVAGEPRIVEHAEGGIVEKIHIKNHGAIKADDILFTLDKTHLKSNSNIYMTRLKHDIAVRDRLIAERDAKVDIKFNDGLLKKFQLEIDEAVIGEQRNIFRTRAKNMQNRLKSFDKELAKTKEEKSGLNGQIQSLTKRIDIKSTEMEGVESLVRQGFVAAQQAKSIENEIEYMRGQLSQYRARVAQTNKDIDRIKIEKSNVVTEFNQDVLGALEEVQLRLSETEEELTKTMAQYSRTEVKAPISGIVYDLQVNTKGAVLAPGEALLKILPNDEVLHINIQIQPHFIDQVKVGQSASFILAAFSQNEIPQLQGKILSLSPDIVLDEMTGMQYYEATAWINPDELQKLGDKQLLPGMPVEAFIRTEAQSPLSYLTRPLTDNLRRAMRES